MKVTVHRGTHQVGGCCTEISTGKSRVFIDCGSSLPGGDTAHLDPVGEERDSRCIAVLVSHYHGDHIGELSCFPESIPVFMGAAARKIVKIYQEHGGGNCPDIDLDHVVEIKNEESFSVGDIRITPYISDHSAFGSFMFLFEGNGKRVLHTGDYRLHGPYRDRLLQKLISFCRGVDLLITEGTSLTRCDKAGYDERTAERMIRDLSGQYKYCFVLCSSGNIDRIAAVARAVGKGRYFLMDSFQKSLLQAVSSLDAEYASCFQKMLSYGGNLAEKAEKRGFCMIVRANPAFEKIVSYYAKKYPDETCLIYSMWSGYLEYPSVKRLFFLSENHRIVHSSGHVTPTDLNRMAELLSPGRILVIHTDSKDPGDGIEQRERVISAEDGEAIEI